MKRITNLTSRLTAALPKFSPLSSKTQPSPSLTVDENKPLTPEQSSPTYKSLQKDSAGAAAQTAGGSGLFKSFLYGSEEGKKDMADLEQSFSKALVRGKYVHEVGIHSVIPAAAPEYLDLVSKYYPLIAANPEHNVNLVGSWRHVVGDQDTYTHIWEFKGYPGFHNSQVSIHKDPLYIEYLQKLRPLLRSRQSHLMQEFNFWGGTASPRQYGGIFELRTYDLKPGKLMEWETSWKRGLECRKQVMEPVGAWFTNLGDIHQVRHLWQFADLEHRRISRQKCWELPGWSDTVHETVELTQKMQSNILVPLSFSPLK